MDGVVLVFGVVKFIENGKWGGLIWLNVIYGIVVMIVVCCWWVLVWFMLLIEGDCVLYDLGFVVFSGYLMV